MPKVAVGKKVPDFQCTATNVGTIRLKNYKGNNLLLYFYPKDNTPGCTLEGQDFAAQHAKFKRQNTVILGISRDSLKSHEKFKEKYDFPFELVTDEDETLCRLFDVIKEKNMYGKKVMGIERSSFLINSQGVLQHEWRKVKVKGHVDEVLASIKTMNKATH